MTTRRIPSPTQTVSAATISLRSRAAGRAIRSATRSAAPNPAGTASQAERPAASTMPIP